MLIDEEPFFKAIPRLTKRVQDNGTPVVFLQVQRFDAVKSPEQEAKTYEDSYILPNTLHKDDVKNLRHKFLTTFGDERISAGDRNVAKMKSSVWKPKVGDQVIDLDDNDENNRNVQDGEIIEVREKKSGLDLYHEVKVIWKNSKKETCYIGSATLKKRRVYLKVDILQDLYQTFQFYGIMYLDEDFRESMHEHIKNRLNMMLPHINTQDDIVKNKVLILTYLSILFAFKVCESIHMKAFEHLCYSVTKSMRTEKKFELETFIPETALEFVIITREGQFRLIHPIVAYEIINFYCSNYSSSLDVLVCQFLKHMLPDTEDQNDEAKVAVNRLLLYREYTDEGKGHLIKKSFSELILTLEKLNSEHALRVFECASELINIHDRYACHFYGHYARYMSKIMKDYDKALEILREASKLAFRSFEEGLMLNIKGDIYRARLENYLKITETLDWKDSNNKAFDFHFNSCQAYQEAYKNNHEDIPLFNEIIVRLNLLKAIKKGYSENEQEFLKFLHGIPDLETSGSVATCLRLVKDLEQRISRNGGAIELENYYEDMAHLKHLETVLYDIMGFSRKELKYKWFELMTKYAAHVNLPSVRRSYIHLCLQDPHPSPSDLDTCLQALEDNFELVGFIDRDMKDWLQITKNMPNIGGNLKEMEKRLLAWKHDGPNVVMNKRNIQANNNPLLANFYLMMCYFVQLIEIEGKDVSPIKEKFINCDAVKLGVNKPQFDLVREWLQEGGTGFGRLRSGKLIESEMMELPGSVGIPSWQEARRSRGNQGFPYINWKGLCIPFNPIRYPNCSFKQGQKVTFGVGFTFNGPQAIILTSPELGTKNLISSKTQEADSKVQSIVSESLTGSPKLQSFSQIAKSKLPAGMSQYKHYNRKS